MSAAPIPPRSLSDLRAIDVVLVFCAVADGHGIDVRRSTSSTFLVAGDAEGAVELRHAALAPFARALGSKREYEVFDCFRRLLSDRLVEEDARTGLWRTTHAGMDAAQRMGAWRGTQRARMGRGVRSGGGRGLAGCGAQGSRQG
jgi:hypothetical protein